MKLFSPAWMTFTDVFVAVRYLRGMIPKDEKNDFYTTGGIVCSVLFFLLMGCSMSPNSSSATIAEAEKNGETISFLGETFFRPEDDESTFLHKDSLLLDAKTIYQTDTMDLNSIIWYGRRLASMYRFRDANTVFSTGISIHPEAPELYRHRGQLYIMTRHLDAAIHDLSKAASLSTTRMIETEPDAIPNKLDLPLSNLRFNIYYYLGLAWYLQGDNKNAIDAFSSCFPFAINPDLKVATSYWSCLSYLRMKDKSSVVSLLSTVDPNEEIIENDAYLRTLLILRSSMDVAELSDSIADSTADPIELYGITNWFTWRNMTTDASIFRARILSSTNWTNIGYIAAEADSSRLLGQ